VEIQALWYNALRVLGELADAFGDGEPVAFLRALSAKVQRSFTAQFWNADAGCLFDVINGEERDGAIRPNQIFAISLRHRMLPAEMERAIVEVVERELFTPVGLRTLSPRDGNYHPQLRGSPRDRDAAYHQGTVWPWLMGPFISAYVKVHDRSEEARARAALWLAGFEEHLRTAGVGHISEIADGESPHTPRGCIAQAWSAGELLRAAVEDVYELDVARPAQTASAGGMAGA